MPSSPANPAFCMNQKQKLHVHKPHAFHFASSKMRAGWLQPAKKQLPAPVPPGTRALPDCPQPETAAFGLRTAEPPRGRKRPSRALYTATPCGVRQRTLRRVLEYFAASTIPHSARHAFIRPKKKKAAPETFPGYGLPSFVSVPSILACFALLRLQPNGGGVSVSPPPPWLPSSPRPVPGRS